MADMNLRAKVAASEVRAGDPQNSTLAIDIKNVSSEAGTAVLYLIIPHDMVTPENVEDLVFAPEELAGENAGDAGDDATRFRLGSARGVTFAPNEVKTLHLSDIAAVKAGEFHLSFEFGPRGSEPQSEDLPVEVLNPGQVPEIMSFSAKSSVVMLRSPKLPVLLSWEVSQGAVVELYLLGKKLLPHAGKPSAPDKVTDYEDTSYLQAGLQPYRLVATQQGRTISRTIYVRVQNPGWNLIACDQGAPMNVVSDGGGALYGLFRGVQGSAIYPLDPDAGSMGTQDRMCPEGEVPEGLASSPAAVFQNKVFVLGGSQYDATQYSKDIQSYDPKGAPGDKWTDLSAGSPWDVPVMGHAVTAFGGRLWVSGGVDANGNTLSSVYYTEDGKTWDKAEDLPEPRCFHAMHGYDVSPGDPVDQRMLCVYGGVDTPYGTPHTSFVFSVMGATWNEMQFYRKSGTSPDPGYGAPFGVAMTTAPVDAAANEAGAASDVLKILATFQDAGTSNLSSGMYQIQGWGPGVDTVNMPANNDTLSDQVVWKSVRNVGSTAQPFRLCAASQGSYIFAFSIIDDLVTDTLTFHVK